MSNSKPAMIIMSIIAFAFGLMMVGNILPPFLDATISEAFTQNFSAHTGAAETEVICTLSYDHYYADTSHMDVDSNEPTDDPHVMTYTESTKEVLVAGLAVSGTRILSVDYVRARDNEQFTYFNGFITTVPFLIGIGLIFMVIKSFF